jgi:hypothetical protein
MVLEFGRKLHSSVSGVLFKLTPVTGLYAPSVSFWLQKDIMKWNQEGNDLLPSELVFSFSLSLGLFKTTRLSG